MTRVHCILYTSALWLIGGLLSVVWGFMHGTLEYDTVRYEQPRVHQAKASAPDIFSVLDGRE